MNDLTTDQSQISLAYLPPTSRQTRAALAGAAVLLLGLAVLIPFAAKPLPKINGFMPALDAIIFVTDLITAGLLLAHFSITRSRALWALACGYLFSAVIIVAHGLTFPGDVSPTGNLFGGSHTNFRIYLLWHLGIPVALFTYVWLRHKDRAKAGARTSIEIVAAIGGTGVLALVSCIACLALLPPVDPVAGRWLTVITMLICAAALALLWVFRRSALDQWLMVVVLAMIVELAITALVGGFGPRRVATLGFYTGRLFSLVTSTVILTGMLAETTRLYARLANANMLANVVKASQALSSEIELPSLIERLMRIAVNHSGAERGLLILLRESKPLIEAHATTGRGSVDVQVRQTEITSSDLPKSALHYLIRTRERVVLDDASVANPYSDDEYLQRRNPKSFLCLPIVKQTKLIGVLYLENNLTPYVFTSGRVAVLEMLASQAAISLENARLYAALEEEDLERKRAEKELRRSEAYLAEAQKLSCTGSFGWSVATDEHFWSDQTYRIFEYELSTKVSTQMVRERVHPEDIPSLDEMITHAPGGHGFDYECRLLLPTGAVKQIHIVAHVVRGEFGAREFVGAVMDVTATRRAEAALRQAQAELAHITRVTTMGELAASIAHEVNQPIAGVVINGNTCLRWLSRVKDDSVNLKEAREAIQRIIRDGNRAGEIIARIRALFKKTELARESLDLNETIREIIGLARSEMGKQRVALRLELPSDLPRVGGDRVQLQQVMLNLILNAIDAMATVEGRARDLVIRTQSVEEREVKVTVRDTGIGLSRESIEDAFKAFHTTKPGGLGMGLSISRSIVENHAGRLWATENEGPGASFCFTLPSHPSESGSDQMP